MKNIDKKKLEQLAKSKNIDKDKIEKIADEYKGKSENELMSELVKIGKNLNGKEEIVSKLKGFLNEDQQKKIDEVMNKISSAEVDDKLNSRKVKKVKKVKKKD
ncbi:MAG: hypothetical protein R3Y64_01225 [Peptostreptococcaceae bacterium]